MRSRKTYSSQTKTEATAFALKHGPVKAAATYNVKLGTMYNWVAKAKNNGMPVKQAELTHVVGDTDATPLIVREAKRELALLEDRKAALELLIGTY